jgi:hypothetical protein
MWSGGNYKRQSSASHRGGSGSRPGQSMQDVMDKVALGQDFLRILVFSPVSIIPPWLSIFFIIFHHELRPQRHII